MTYTTNTTFVNFKIYYIYCMNLGQNPPPYEYLVEQNSTRFLIRQNPPGYKRHRTKSPRDK